MEKETGPLDMLKEPRAKPLTLMRPLHQPRDIGDDKAPVVAEPYKPQIRHDGGKGIVGDLRLCGRYARDKCRLSGIRKADYPDIGQ